MGQFRPSALSRPAYWVLGVGKVDTFLVCLEFFESLYPEYAGNRWGIVQALVLNLGAFQSDWPLKGLLVYTRLVRCSFKRL